MIWYMFIISLICRMRTFITFPLVAIIAAVTTICSASFYSISSFLPKYHLSLLIYFATFLMHATFSCSLITAEIAPYHAAVY